MPWDNSEGAAADGGTPQARAVRPIRKTPTMNLPERISF